MKGSTSTSTSNQREDGSPSRPSARIRGQEWLCRISWKIEMEIVHFDLHTWLLLVSAKSSGISFSKPTQTWSITPTFPLSLPLNEGSVLHHSPFIRDLSRFANPILIHLDFSELSKPHFHFHFHFH